MGGEGSMLHMINTLKNNRNLRRSRRRKFKNAKDEVNASIEWQYKAPNISDEKLEQIKNEIRLQTQKDQKKHFILSVALFMLFILVLSVFWKYIF